MGFYKGNYCSGWHKTPDQFQENKIMQIQHETEVNSMLLFIKKYKSHWEEADKNDLCKPLLKTLLSLRCYTARKPHPLKHTWAKQNAEEGTYNFRKREKTQLYYT